MLFGTELEAVVPFLSEVRSHTRKGRLCNRIGDRQPINSDGTPQ
jgi:hypothetical protein